METSRVEDVVEYLTSDRCKLNEKDFYGDIGQIHPFQWEKCDIENQQVGILQTVFSDPHDKSVYEGEWLNGMKCGRGIRLTECGGRYDGMWRDDMHHGYGRLINDEGDILEGQWKEDQLNGPGSYQWGDGTKVYNGNFLNGKMHGYGVQTWKNGQYYKGQYVKNRKHGVGEFKQANGTIYRGPFQRDKMHGQGEIEHVNGQKRKGQWENDIHLNWL